MGHTVTIASSDRAGGGEGAVSRPQAAARFAGVERYRHWWRATGALAHYRALGGGTGVAVSQSTMCRTRRRVGWTVERRRSERASGAKPPVGRGGRRVRSCSWMRRARRWT